MVVYYTVKSKRRVKVHVQLKVYRCRTKLLCIYYCLNGSFAYVMLGINLYTTKTYSDVDDKTIKQTNHF